MRENNTGRWAAAFSLLVVSAAVILFSGASMVGASDDHETARMLRDRGDILPLSELLQHPALAGQRVLEAELENEHGQLVYELELLDETGYVRERYFDATTGQPLD
jgi:uncharacterized membrane protein YkoI